MDAPDTPTNDEYWGPKLLAAMPQCATATFNHADTTNHGWADDALLESYCRTALLPPVSERNRTGTGAFGRGDTVVRNKVSGRGRLGAARSPRAARAELERAPRGRARARAR